MRSGSTATALLLFLAAAGAPAQTLRLHDAARAKTAQDAVDAFAASRSDVFDAMVANVDAADASDLRLLEQRNEQTVESAVTSLPSWTWSQFGLEITRAEQRYEAAATAALETIAAASGRLPSLQEAVDHTRQRSREASGRLTEAEGRLAGRLATVAQFRKAVDALLAAKDLSDVRELQKLTDLPASLRTLLDNARASGNATGLQLTLLRLGLEIARAEAALAQEELRAARMEIDRAATLVERISRVGRDLDRLQAFADRQPDDVPIAATIRAVADRAQSDHRVENELAETLAALAVYPAAIGYEMLFLESATILAASDEQRASIRRSEISLTIDAALVRHGLGALSSYSAGGLRPADVANLFRALQTIALAVIAGAA